MKIPLSTFTFLLRLFLVSTAINYVWEMAQMPLYREMPFDDPMSWWLCFRAGLGDGLIVILIWAVGVLLFRRRGWFLVLTAPRIVVLLLTGAGIAVGIEYFALIHGRWSYSPLMPLIPLLGVGLSPFLQLLVLPLPLMRYAAAGGRG